MEGSVSVSLLANGSPVVAKVDLAASAGLSAWFPHFRVYAALTPLKIELERVRARPGRRWYCLDPQRQPGKPLNGGTGG